jgi:hypothetical protein
VRGTGSQPEWHERRRGRLPLRPAAAAVTVRGTVTVTTTASPAGAVSATGAAVIQTVTLTQWRNARASDRHRDGMHARPACQCQCHGHGGYPEKRSGFKYTQGRESGGSGFETRSGVIPQASLLYGRVRP